MCEVEVQHHQATCSKDDSLCLYLQTHQSFSLLQPQYRDCFRNLLLQIQNPGVIVEQVVDRGCCQNSLAHIWEPLNQRLPGWSQWFLFLSGILRGLLYGQGSAIVQTWFWRPLVQSSSGFQAGQDMNPGSAIYHQREFRWGHWSSQSPPSVIRKTG